MYNAFPHLFLSFSATFLGLMQTAWDSALAYLTGRMPGAPIPHTEIAAKGHAVAEMLFVIEAARALYYRAISEARVDPPLEAVQRPGGARHRATRGRHSHPGGDPCLWRTSLSQALSARALRPRCAGRSADAPVDPGDCDAAGLGSSAWRGRAAGRCRRGVTTRPGRRCSDTLAPSRRDRQQGSQVFRSRPHYPPKSVQPAVPAARSDIVANCRVN